MGLRVDVAALQRKTMRSTLGDAELQSLVGAVSERGVDSEHISPTGGSLRVRQDVDVTRTASPVVSGVRGGKCSIFQVSLHGGHCGLVRFEVPTMQVIAGALHVAQIDLGVLGNFLLNA